MILTQITDSEELSELFLEILLANTDKVTKVSEGSVLKGTARGIGKLSQIALQNIAVLEGRLFPDSAYGEILDEIALREGVPARFGAIGSSTYVRVFATPGTVYTMGVHTFQAKNGIVFNMTIPDNSITISDFGFAYIPVYSTTQGVDTNVDAFTIDTVSPIPVGHQYCTNEYAAIGGYTESDDMFRERIKKRANILSKNTFSSLEQYLNYFVNTTFKVKHLGLNSLGQTRIGIASMYPMADTTIESITTFLTKYVSLTDHRPQTVRGNFRGIKVENIEYQPIDISFRCQLKDPSLADITRKNIQINLNKYFDYRTFDKVKIEWDDLLNIVKTTPNVDYVPDEYFTPFNDIVVDVFKLPRVRGFIMMDIDGDIITSLTGTLNPIYYPPTPDLYFQTSILANL